MSRSYRKNPIIKDPDSRGSKRIFNRRLRRSQIENDLLPQNSNYRKMNESWDIHDFSFYVDKDSTVDIRTYLYDESEKEAESYWKRKYLSK